MNLEPSIDRKATLLKSLPLHSPGLEVGAGYNPLVRRSEGLDVYLLDHATKEELETKYAAHGVTVDVPQIDYIFDGRPLADVITDRKFGWIVASHVLEHVPDLIGFINGCADVLDEGGVLSVALPDRRFSFDYYRPSASLSAVVDAHLEGRRISSTGVVIEHLQNAAHYNGQISWPSGKVGEPELLHGPLPSATYTTFYEDIFVKRRHHDIHAWVFTSSSFRLLISDLSSLGLLKLREHDFTPTVGGEFFMQLSKAGAGAPPDRLSLARAALSESGPLPATNTEAA